MKMYFTGAIVHYTLQLENHNEIYRQVTFASSVDMYNWLGDNWPKILETHTAWITKIKNEIPVMYETPKKDDSTIQYVDTAPFDALEEPIDRKSNLMS